VTWNIWEKHRALMEVPMGEIMFSYKNCFKAMEEARILDMDDPFMRESFTTMYLPILEDVVDEYMGL
jgi:hypothetical protein